MEVRDSLLYLNPLLLTDSQKSKGAEQVASTRQDINKSADNKARDVVTLSDQSKQPYQNNNFNLQRGSTLISENIEKTDNGVRITKEFENTEGRKFTRIEELVNSENRFKRTVVQQNTSGNTTLLESIFDRQNDGSFRLTQRYTDETGETKTNIQFDAQPDNKDIILGRLPDPSQTNQPFDLLRGSQFDVSA